MSETDPIKAKLRTYVDKRRRFEDAKRELKTAEDDFREYEADLWEELDEAADGHALTFDLGEGYGDFQFVPNQTITGYVLDPEAFQEYLENSGRVDELTKVEFRKAIVNEMAREAIGESRPLPPGVDFTARRFITMTKRKPKKRARV